MNSWLGGYYIVKKDVGWTNFFNFNVFEKPTTIPIWNMGKVVA